MKINIKHIKYTIIAVLFATSCSDDNMGINGNGEFVEGEVIESSLCVMPDRFFVTVDGSRAGNNIAATDAENRIENLWVFQFDATTGQQLIKPRFYTISNQNELNNLKVWLHPYVKSKIYVVTNTHGGGLWGTTIDASTEAKLLEANLANVRPMTVDDMLLPMTGNSEEVIVNGASTTVVPVYRMYAKLKIKIGMKPDNATLRNIDVQNIPEYCRVGTIFKDEKTAGEYPDGTEYISRALSAKSDDNATPDETEYIMYVPENIHGENSNDNDRRPEDKPIDAPANALMLELNFDVTDSNNAVSSKSYTFYPGGDNYKNFNIKRNCIYNITINIKELDNRHTPSANCILATEGQTISFEPYYRTETGGGYRFSDYVDFYDESLAKVIDRVEIIWQTKDCIGDNSKGDLVWMDTKEQQKFDKEHSKLYVKANKEGNALVAAYNYKNEIIWSWHIWVTRPDFNPADKAEAITYYTYKWDNKHIYSQKYYDDLGQSAVREKGYDLMRCNLGALADEPSAEDPDGFRTWGMWYQWGRKDPFPCHNKGRHGVKLDYGHSNFIENHYGNDNTTVVGKTAGEDPSGQILFRSLAGKNINQSQIPEGGIRYAIAHPTVFMCGTKDADPPLKGDRGDEAYPGYTYNYAQPDYGWTWEQDDCLWGGTPPKTDGTMDYHVFDNGQMTIYRNSGDEKTIFDPSPYGWRVPAGDLWLGFTYTGDNPYYTHNDDLTEINYEKLACDGGMYMYVEDWKKGASTFFPTPGIRLADGEVQRVGSCGNYLNVSISQNRRVNIIHIHDEAHLFKVAETMISYTVRSVAGPIRCVRDSK